MDASTVPLFNAVPKVFLHNWKEWVTQQTKYCNNVIMTSVSVRKKKIKIKLMKQMPPDMKHIILTNMNVKVYSWLLAFRKISSATDLRGGVIVLIPDFSADPFWINSEFFFENWSTITEVIVKIKVEHFFETWGRVIMCVIEWCFRKWNKITPLQN